MCAFSEKNQECYSTESMLYRKKTLSSDLSLNTSNITESAISDFTSNIF